MSSGPARQDPVLYATTVDVSESNGPGVNEREFTQALQRRFGSAVAFVLPTPAHGALAQGTARVFHFRAFRARAFYLVNQLQMLRTLLRVNREIRPSLVVSRCGDLPLGLALFARLVKVPIALKTLGDPTMTYLCAKPGYKGVIARALRPLNLWAYQTLIDRSVSVDCCTPQLVARNVNFLKQVDSAKLSVVENATNVERFQPAGKLQPAPHPALEASHPVVGYVGGVPWERGGVQIIKAIALLRNSYPSILGVIVGGAGPMLESLRELSRELDVEANCLIVGQVAYEQVADWINWFDIGVAMDLPERAGVVGSSNQKIRQYLACGKPVIASSGVNEFLDLNDLGSTVDVTDIEAFVAAIEGILTRKDGAAMAARARAYACSHFSIDATLLSRMDKWVRAGIVLPSAPATAE
jgi:glycosyltransferase involved in cell wall biosynthesis